MNFAEITISGNCAADAVLTPNTQTDPKKNNARCSFTVVVNEDYGDKKQHTNFPVVVWGKYAEKIAQYLKSGKQVLVAGRPTLFKVGHLLEKPEREIRAFSIRARVIKLGNDSQKNRTNSGALIDPGVAAAIKLMAGKTGTTEAELNAVMNAARTAKPAQAAEAATPAPQADGGNDVPFGDDVE